MTSLTACRFLLAEAGNGFQLPLALLALPLPAASGVSVFRRVLALHPRAEKKGWLMLLLLALLLLVNRTTRRSKHDHPKSKQAHATSKQDRPPKYTGPRHK